MSHLILELLELEFRLHSHCCLTAGKTEIEELGHKAFLKKIVFISFSAGCSSEFLGKINLFIFYYPKQKVVVANDLE